MVHKMNRQQYYRYELLRNLHCRSVFNVPACPTSYIPSLVSQNRRHRSQQTDRCRTIFLPNCQPFSCKTFRPSPRNTVSPLIIRRPRTDCLFLLTLACFSQLSVSQNRKNPQPSCYRRSDLRLSSPRLRI